MSQPSPRHPNLVISNESTESLTPFKKNARRHPDRQIKQIMKSIQEFGFINPILVDESHNIIAGHARFEAAKLLRLGDVPAIGVPGLSEAQKRALALADNKIALNSGWDAEILAAELDELAVLLPDCGLSLEITGFEPAEVDNLMVDFAIPKPSRTRPSHLSKRKPARCQATSGSSARTGFFVLTRAMLQLSR